MMLSPLFSVLQISFSLGGGLDPNFGENVLFGIFKLFFIIGAVLYAAFAFIVIRQVDIMRKTLITDFSPLFTTLAYAHFALALFVVFFFYTTL